MAISNLVQICDTVPKFHKLYPDYRIHIENYNASSERIVYSLRRYGLCGQILFSLEMVEQNVKDFLRSIEKLIELGKEENE